MDDDDDDDDDIIMTRMTQVTMTTNKKTKFMKCTMMDDDDEDDDDKIMMRMTQVNPLTPRQETICLLQNATSANNPSAQPLKVRQPYI
jgi:hypothetical protein